MSNNPNDLVATKAAADSEMAAELAADEEAELVAEIEAEEELWCESIPSDEDDEKLDALFLGCDGERRLPHLVPSSQPRVRPRRSCWRFTKLTAWSAGSSCRRRPRWPWPPICSFAQPARPRMPNDRTRAGGRGARHPRRHAVHCLDDGQTLEVALTREAALTLAKMLVDFACPGEALRAAIVAGRA